MSPNLQKLLFGPQSNVDIPLQIKWFKGGKELETDKYPITHTDGVITIEIMNSMPADSGKYKCVATNSLGSDTTECVVICEGMYECIGEKVEKTSLKSNSMSYLQAPT